MGTVFKWPFLLGTVVWLLAGCTPSVYQSPIAADGPPGMAHGDLRALPDAVPRPEKPCRGCARPYVVGGVRYVPLATSQGYQQRGGASWYGTAFHGKPTASGEPYDMFAMTAAHKTLPLPGYVRVRNLQNGRQVIVKINDRGPFRPGRIIDLSYAAAVKLGIDKTGTADVEVTALPVGPGNASVVALSAGPVPTAVLPLVGSVYQAGAFARLNNAVSLRARLVAAGIEPVAIVAVEVNGLPLHRVQVGPVAVALRPQITARLRDLGLFGINLVIK